MAGSGQDRADVPRGGRTRLYASARHRGAERRGRPRLGMDCGAVSAHQEGCQQGVLHSRQRPTQGWSRLWHGHRGGDEGW